MGSTLTGKENDWTLETQGVTLRSWGKKGDSTTLQGNGRWRRELPAEVVRGPKLAVSPWSQAEKYKCKDISIVLPSDPALLLHSQRRERSRECEREREREKLYQSSDTANRKEGARNSVTTLCLCSVVSIMSGSLWRYGLQSARLLCPLDFPGKNTGVGCHPPPEDFPTRDRTCVACVSGVAGGFFITGPP